MKNLNRLSKVIILLSFFLYAAVRVDVLLTQPGWNFWAVTDYQKQADAWLIVAFNIGLVLFYLSAGTLIEDIDKKYRRWKGLAKEASALVDEYGIELEYTSDELKNALLQNYKLEEHVNDLTACNHYKNMYDILLSNSRTWMDKYRSEKSRADLAYQQFTSMKASKELYETRMSGMCDTQAQIIDCQDTELRHLRKVLKQLIDKLPYNNDVITLAGNGDITIQPKDLKNGSNKKANRKS